MNWFGNRLDEKKGKHSFCVDLTLLYRVVGGHKALKYFRFYLFYDWTSFCVSASALTFPSLNSLQVFRFWNDNENRTNVKLTFCQSGIKFVVSVAWFSIHSALIHCLVDFTLLVWSFFFHEIFNVKICVVCIETWNTWQLTQRK